MFLRKEKFKDIELLKTELNIFGIVTLTLNRINEKSDAANNFNVLHYFIFHLFTFSKLLQPQLLQPKLSQPELSQPDLSDELINSLIEQFIQFIILHKLQYFTHLYDFLCYSAYTKQDHELYKIMTEEIKVKLELLYNEIILNRDIFKKHFELHYKLPESAWLTEKHLIRELIIDIRSLMSYTSHLEYLNSGLGIHIDNGDDDNFFHRAIICMNILLNKIYESIAGTDDIFLTKNWTLFILEIIQRIRKILSEKIASAFLPNWKIIAAIMTSSCDNIIKKYADIEKE